MELETLALIHKIQQKNENGLIHIRSFKKIEKIPNQEIISF